MKYFLKDINHPTKPWKKVVLIVASVVVGSYAAFMGAYFATSGPSFCALCHEIKPIVTSWRVSPHKDVKCLYCHESRGFLGKLHSEARGLNDIYLQLTGQYTLLTKAQVFEQNCVACHLGDYWNYPKTKRLNLKHYEFIKANKSCIECHRDAGHKVKIFSSQKFKK